MKNLLIFLFIICVFSVKAQDLTVIKLDADTVNTITASIDSSYTADAEIDTASIDSAFIRALVNSIMSGDIASFDSLYARSVYILVAKIDTIYSDTIRVLNTYVLNITGDTLTITEYAIIDSADIGIAEIDTVLIKNFITTPLLKLLDTDKTHKLSLSWSENETNNYSLYFQVNSGSRTFSLHENLTLLNGFDFQLQSLGQLNQLTLNEYFTIGDGSSGTLTFTGGAPSVLTCQANTSVNQDLLTTSNVTHNQIEIDTVIQNGMIIFRECISLADDDSLFLPDATTLTGNMWVDGNAYTFACDFHVDDGGVAFVFNEAEATNCDNADTDTKLCLIDRGTRAVIKNRTGATKTICYIIQYKQ